MYKIKRYSYVQAKKLGVQIYPSTRKGKKIDVYRNGVKIASIGDIRYKDYPTYIEQYGKAYAGNRRKLYYIRHNDDIKLGTPGYYAAKILW